MEVEVQLLLCVIFPQLCERYWCSLNTREHKAGAVSVQVLQPSSDWGPHSCTAGSAGLLQVSSSPPLALDAHSLLGESVPMPVVSHQSTGHGEGRATLPSLLRPSSAAPQSSSLTAAGTVAVLFRAHSSEIVSSNVTKSKLSHGPSWWFWFPVSIHLQLLALCNLNCQAHGGKSCWRYLISTDLQLLGAGTLQPTGSFLIHWQQGKNQLQHHFFYSSGISS